MEAKIYLMGLNAKIPATSFGFNAITGVYIRFRMSSSDPGVVYGIVDHLSLGGQGGNIVSGVITDWFSIDISDFRKLKEKEINLLRAENLRASLELKGGLYLGLGQGAVDVKFDVIEPSGESISVIDKRHRPATGLLINDVSLEGELVMKELE